MINYNSIWYEAWNGSHIRHHFSSFNEMIEFECDFNVDG